MKKKLWTALALTGMLASLAACGGTVRMERGRTTVRMREPVRTRYPMRARIPEPMRRAPGRKLLRTQAPMRPVTGKR